MHKIAPQRQKLISLYITPPRRLFFFTALQTSSWRSCELPKQFDAVTPPTKPPTSYPQPSACQGAPCREHCHWVRLFKKVPLPLCTHFVWTKRSVAAEESPPTSHQDGCDHWCVPDDEAPERNFESSCSHLWQRRKKSVSCATYGRICCMLSRDGKGFDGFRCDVLCSSLAQ